MQVNRIDFADGRNNPLDVVHNFEVGDVIFERQTSKSFIHYPVESIIVLLQQTMQKLGKWIGKDFNLKTDLAKITHVFQIVEVNKETGQVLLADTIPERKNQFRIIDLWKDHSINLKPGATYEYDIVHLEDRNLALASAGNIIRLTQKASYLLTEEEKLERKEKNQSVKSRFSFKHGLKAILKNRAKDMTYTEKKHMMKKVVDQILESPISTGGQKNPKSYYCSYFVADQLLGSKVAEAFQKMHAGLSIKERREINDWMAEAFKMTEGMEYRNAEGKLSELAEKMASKYGDRLLDELDKLPGTLKVDMKVREKGNEKTITRIIDPKYTSPQVLGGILTKEGVGHVVGTIAANPKSSKKNKDEPV